MSGTVRIHPAALEEAEDAIEWYRRQSTRAAQMFLDELDRALIRIGDHPRQFAEYVVGTRRMVLRKFPYLIVFRHDAPGLEIIAVAHGSRRRATGEIVLNNAGGPASPASPPTTDPG